MNKIIFILLLLINVYSYAQKMNTIPKQIVNLYKVSGFDKEDYNDTIDKFEISNFITYKEYKQFLLDVKNDTTYPNYINLLPDSNISSNIDVYNKYINSSEYDNYPVLGISWDNAMLYCKWKTLKEKQNDSILFVYTLPKLSLWLTAYNYFEKNNIKNDFNKKYSDWLYATFDDASFSDLKTKSFAKLYDYHYLHMKEDYPEKKRKVIIGNSYLYQHNEILYNRKYGYSFEGYRQVSFRIIKHKNENFTELFKFWGINNE